MAVQLGAIEDPIVITSATVACPQDAETLRRLLHDLAYTLTTGELLGIMPSDQKLGPFSKGVPVQQVFWGLRQEDRAARAIRKLVQLAPKAKQCTSLFDEIQLYLRLLKMGWNPHRCGIATCNQEIEVPRRNPENFSIRCTRCQSELETELAAALGGRKKADNEVVRCYGTTGVSPFEQTHNLLLVA
jgi:hypothetical protein